MGQQLAADLAVSLPAAMTIDQFCRSYCVGKTKTYSEIKSGRLKIRKLGSKTIIARADAEAWLASLPLANAV
ncbi:helix-turn-helix domain-containing protein [Bradyrhizobium septentrionale]|nr:helix-turn-helix domain-containing protein [Bradyrhizobium septentrionale]UGY18612.1 helix-turn-helix domain-containing protein [Bradyrhizobium septentrionale]